MRAEPVIAYVGLGANLGSAEQMIVGALQALDDLPGTRVLRRSSLYRSAPFQASGSDYINAVAALRTHLCAPELLAALQGLENAAGRERPYPNAPRTLDLDLLSFGDARIDSPRLTVPHPRMSERAFVLLPLAEIAADRVSPELIEQTRGQAIVRIEVHFPEGS